jgi:hypothetical protein
MKVFERIEEALVRRKKYDAAQDIQSFLGRHFTSAQKKQKAWRARYVSDQWNGALILQQEYGGKARKSQPWL